MNTTFRRRMMASTLLIRASLFAVPALAQSADTTSTQAAPGTGDPVTGAQQTSDIGDQAAPGQGHRRHRLAHRVLDADLALAAAGSSTRRTSRIRAPPTFRASCCRTPAFGTPGISRTNSNFSTSSAGVATVDLRNLGSNRTLVLVDGRRFVAGIPGTSTVDLNTIPAAFIERTDVLTGGASAVYGSDAVAGVVNIIYKKHFEGVEGNAQVGISQEGGDAEKYLNLTLGHNFDDDRGNIMTYIGYVKQGAVFSQDRKRSAVDQFSTGAGVTGDINDIFSITRPFFSSFAPQGRHLRGTDRHADVVHL